ncbi:MAG TPA: hypothetical protein PLM07_05885 [Candidatus Rifleibacterium sp.]|nr:hypothetical protein [Candidatus Rifleibacterium sp.]HPT45410.1 hypothetical protein [Candidatus Rifleibacterium sp.]
MNKKGMAIPLVLIFATVLGLLSTYIIKNTQQYNRSNQMSFAQLQVHFVARAGVEHAMLKIKFLHRELYDAICLAQGRNPLFDFTQIKNLDEPEKAISQYNPGPIFLYRQGQFPNNRLLTQGFTVNAGSEKRWINEFMADIKSQITKTPAGDSNAVLSMQPLPNQISNLMKEPFKKAQYGIKALNIAAQEIAENDKDGAVKVHNTAIIELLIKATIETARGEAWDYDIKKTVKINRD